MRDVAVLVLVLFLLLCMGLVADRIAYQNHVALCFADWCIGDPDALAPE